MTLVAAPVIAALSCSSSPMPTPADSHAWSTCGRRVTRAAAIRSCRLPAGCARKPPAVMPAWTSCGGAACSGATADV